jgi:hypothetical protein
MDLLGGGDGSANSFLGFGAGGGRDVNFKLDRTIIDEVTTPRLMSIYRGE